MSDPFKAYDIRGVYPYEVNEDLAYDVGRALPHLFSCKTVVLGYDGRTSSDSLFDSVLKGLLESGTNVINIGRCTTPQYYYAIFSSDVDGGIMITASHNPKEYNGFKICQANAVPIFKENCLPKLKHIIEQKHFKVGASKGHYIEKNIQGEYRDYFAKLAPKVKDFKVLVDTGNGMGINEVHTLQELFHNVTFDTLFEDIDGTFPHHECNPVKDKLYTELVKQLNEKDYDFGVAIDGDADRAVFYTKEGMISPDLITGIIGRFRAKRHEKVGYEVRSSQAVPRELKKKGIKPLLYPSGSAYMKKRMKEDGAVFAGEKSGHYFYQNLHNTDSSLYTIMNMLALLSKENKTLDELKARYTEGLFSSGEVNYTVDDPDAALVTIKKEFKELKIKEIDGVSGYGEDFFFNVRKSNTEPLVRVNIEASDKKKLKEIKEKIEKTISR